MSGAVDHARFVASLDAGTRARLTRPSDRAGLLHLAGHLGLLLVLGGLIVARVPLWPLLLLPYGVALIFLFTLEHEATHATPFASGWMNMLAGHLTGLLLILPFQWFRLFHLAHHRHTNDPRHDPELATPKPEGWRAFALHVSGLPVWWAQLRQLVTNALGRTGADFVPDRARPRVRREARVMLAVYALALSSLWLSDMLLWLWIVPALIGQPFLRVYLLAEHGRCPTVANMFANSRTTLTNRLVRFVAWNMPYHAEHHAWPTVPFHALPRVHALARDHLQVTSRGYARFAGEYTAGFDADPRPEH